MRNTGHIHVMPLLIHCKKGENNTRVINPYKSDIRYACLIKARGCVWAHAAIGR